MNIRTISKTEALWYETQASAWWMSWIGHDGLQNIAARYLAWKVNRKYARILSWQKLEERVRAVKELAKTT